jgi:hypothetical protein
MILSSIHQYVYLLCKVRIDLTNEIISIDIAQMNIEKWHWRKFIGETFYTRGLVSIQTNALHMTRRLYTLCKQSNLTEDR